ncbi:MAG: BamA/TamA family outer membrane protein [Acidobacteria bacterium]|nr:BamA/TamA family outer membrane protein [Acidobacteriota bacterium]
MKALHWFRISLLFCVASLLYAAPPQTNAHHRLRVGLVLSGGGARGAAHIGVLKALEKLHIPIDAIVGTSGGALAGGLYASGMSPNQIQHLLLDTNWDKMFQDAPDRNHLSWRRKQDNGKYLPNLELGLKNGKLMMPTGLSAGRKISFMLHRALLRTGGIRDFDKLPIPFRAVATDLTTGQMVVLSHGDLANALRASMSVPGAIAPFELNGRLLVDGGLVRNLPVDVMRRQMHVDVIIAVNVAKGLFPKNRLNSALAVSQQMITIMLLKDEKTQLALLKKGDVYIKPKLGDMAASDFTGMGKAIKPGEEATMAHRKALQCFAIPEKQYAAFLSRLRHVPLGNRIVDFINLSDKSKLAPKVLLSRIKTKTGKPLNLKTLQNDLDRIYQIGAFESVNFEWVKAENKNGLLIRTKSKPWGTQFLQAGLKLSDDLQGDSRFDVLLSHTMTEVNPYGGEWKNEIQMGRTRRIRTEFFQPLDAAGRWAILPFMEYSSGILDSYESSYGWKEYDIRLFKTGFLAGRQFGNWGAAMVGLTRKWGSSSPFSVFQNNNTGEKDDINIAGYTFRFDYDQLDDPYFPVHGGAGYFHFFRSSRTMGSDFSYYKVDLRFEQVSSFGANTIIFTGEYGDSLGTTLPFYDNFRLGGIFHLTGFQPGRLTGDSKIFTSIVYYRNLPIEAFGFKFYAGGSIEAGSTWMNTNRFSVNKLSYSGSLFVGSRTLIGAVYIGYGRSDDGSDLFFLTLGQIF